MRLLTPWAAAGTLDSQETRAFTAALARDPALQADLADVRAEQAAVCELAEALGRPSPRPLLELFAAIDREQGPLPPNVTQLASARASRRLGHACARVAFRSRELRRAR